ncbi:hypothetical protein QYG89_00045 [Bacillus sp. B190/17]|uniref:Mga helix-turn-helix domain-containing protein n=1 Tax=Bacillus lumedeiriae TaxID=3058829 RepID=A0ABW8I3L9_9BACI
MNDRKGVLERRLQHEGLRSVIPNVEDCKLRFVYEQKDQLFEWLLFEKEHQNYGCLIEHQADQMNISSNLKIIEQCQSYELDVQALLKVADLFFNSQRNKNWQPLSQKKNKRFEAFQTCLEIFSFLKESKDGLAAVQMEHKEVEFVVSLFKRLRELDEMGKNQHHLLLWRKTELFNQNERLQFLKGLHSAFIIFRKLAKLPFHEAYQLGIPQIRMMTRLRWRWLHWQVYTYWHDEYFYLFSRWKSNPNDFETMQQTLLNVTNPVVSRLYPKEINVLDLTLSCKDELFRFQKEAGL